MNILVIGCHRVGSNLARALDLAGHDVAVLAENEADLERLDRFSDYEFSGMCYCGIPVDVEVLRNAGIEHVEAVACVTSDDNINLMVAQIANTMFHIDKVICRVADPVSKDVFSNEFGLRVISPTNLTVETFLDALLEDLEPSSLAFGSSTMGFLHTPVTAQQIGLSPLSIAPTYDRMLFGVLQYNGVCVLANTPDIILQQGDELIWVEILD